MSSDELGLANFAQQAFRSNPQVLVFGHEQTELAGQVSIRLVVRRCRKEDALAVVLPDVFLNSPVSLTLPISQIVALVDEHEAVAAHVGEFRDCPAD